MWHTQWAAVTGRGHLRRGLPCQDRVCTLTQNGVTAAALADGAGSQPLSQEGAEAAVERACQILCRDFGQLMEAATPMELRRSVLVPVREAILRRAEALGAEVSALACTLLAVAVRGDEYLLLHTGDGVIAYQKAGRVLLASTPQNGEFANATTFVTSPQALRNTKVLRGRQEGLEGFLLMSDGCGTSLYQHQTGKVAPLAGRLLQRAELLDRAVSQDQLAAVLDRAIAHRTQDDCSLALLTRSTERFGRWERLTPREQAQVLGVRTQNRNRRRRMIRRYAAIYGAVPSNRMAEQERKCIA